VLDQFAVSAASSLKPEASGGEFGRGFESRDAMVGSGCKLSFGDRQLPDDLLATPLHLVQVRDHHQQPRRTEGRVVGVCVQLAHELSLANDARPTLGNIALGPRQLPEQI
jgi:hypothetical protein